ncbi:hypothetical protein ET471_00610 [Xylanimonas protaetiae]|uniref:Uncharacterized protein n=1 Tax=Xylanimonas protaetiae TaxID=2509457 RepID=A0A4P6FDR5_9MICO|nr:hypothetical protein ET471_00610 [Xylanimonas protaetiae]
MSLRWTDRPGRWSLLAAGVGEGAQAPEIELTWPRDASTPWLWPGVGVGALLLLAGLFLLLARRGGTTPAEPAADGAGTAPLGTTEPATPGGTATADGADAGRAGVAASLGRRWPVSLRTPGAGDGAPSDVAPADAPDAPAAHGADRTESSASAAGIESSAAGGADAPVDAGAAGDEPAQRPSRPALISRRSRRRAEASEPAPEEAPAAVAPASDTPAPGTPAEPVSAEEPAPAGRRWGFAPVFGGSPAPAQAPAPAAWPAPAPQPPAPQPAATQQATPQPTPPSAPPAAVPGDAAAEAPTATGSLPRLTRRELRAQEEARKAAEQTGITGRLRALTGQIPAVRPAAPQPPADPAAAPPRASRSQAWRQAWGFDPESADRPTDNDTEGGAR